MHCIVYVYIVCVDGWDSCGFRSCSMTLRQVRNALNCVHDLRRFVRMVLKQPSWSMDYPELVRDVNLCMHARACIHACMTAMMLQQACGTPHVKRLKGDAHNRMACMSFAAHCGLLHIISSMQARVPEAGP